jgi:dihydrofolate reductase
MRKLAVFNHVSLDGYFVDGNGSMYWAKAADQNAEWNAFVAENASGEGPLVFGRVTYELMTSYWPTPMAKQNDAALAERMNHLPKVVFSRTLNEASWNNTKLVKGDMVAEMRRMKEEPGDTMTILGSGSLVSQLAQEGLIDEYMFVVNPIALGKGRTMFEGGAKAVDLKLTRTRAFGNGNVFLCYEAVV